MNVVRPSAVQYYGYPHEGGHKDDNEHAYLRSIHSFPTSCGESATAFVQWEAVAAAWRDARVVVVIMWLCTVALPAITVGCRITIAPTGTVTEMMPVTSYISRR